MRKIEVANEIAERLVVDAAARGVSLNDYLAQMLCLDSERSDTSFDMELDQLLSGLQHDEKQSLPLEFSRADIYQDHP